MDGPTVMDETSLLVLWLSHPVGELGPEVGMGCLFDKAPGDSKECLL